MMNYFMFSCGTIVLLAIVLDLVYTTFSPNQAGFFTNLITQGSYNLIRKICVILRSNKLLESAGVLIIIQTIFFWYLLIWLGSSLMLHAAPQAVVHNLTQAPADFIETLYYTGFTLSTLGVGDYTASTNTWRIFTVFLSFSGFILLTTGISYMLPVLSAAVFKRSLGSYIATLGANPLDILQKQWRNGTFSMLAVHFNKITEMLIQHNQELLAYPVVYCFYTSNPKKAAALNIGKIDEIITILLIHIPEEHRPDTASVYPLREAISDFLIIQRENFIKHKAANPFIPNVESLRQAGIPLLSDQNSILQEYQRLAKRRELMGAVLKNQARDFHDIYHEYADYDISL